MSYLALDLDAKKRIPRVAKACGSTPGEILWGLMELWEHAWLAKKDVVGEMVMAGCFGPSADVRSALVAFGFIESDGDSYRVKGADKWLRITEGRSDGGKKSAGNLIPGARQKKAAAEKTEKALSAGSRLPLGSLSAPSGLVLGLSPSTQHPAPIKRDDVRELELSGESEPEPDATEAVRRLWAEKAPPGLSRFRATDGRRTAVKARLASCSLSEIGEAIARMHRSAFLRGEKPGQTWRPDIDWLLKPDTIPKILEGKYDDAAGDARPPAPEVPPCSVVDCEFDGTQEAPDTSEPICQRHYYAALADWNARQTVEVAS